MSSPSELTAAFGVGSAELCGLHAAQGLAAAVCVSPVLVPEQDQPWGRTSVISKAAQSRGGGGGGGDSPFEIHVI